MSEELLPCPFCGSHKLTLLEPTCLPSTPYDPSDRLYPVVRCGQCHADVPGGNLDYKGRSAITAWNKRAAISVSDGGGSDASGASALEKKEAVTRNTAVLQMARKASEAWFSESRTHAALADAISALTYIIVQHHGNH